MIKKSTFSRLGGLTFLSGAIWFCCGCNGTPNGDGFDPALFPITAQNPVLCLDFSKDHRPNAGLIIDHANLASREPVVLPFAATVGIPRNAEYATSSAKGITVISIYAPNSGAARTVISMSPEFDNPPAPGYGVPAFTGNIYFARNGLDRRLFVRFPDDKGGYQNWPNHIRSRPGTPLSAVAVAIPEGAERFEVSSGRLEIPSGQILNARTRLYPVPPIVSSAGRDPAALEISYRVKPTSTQELIGEYSAKFTFAMIPMATWLLLAKFKPQFQAQRWRWFWGCVVLQVIVWIVAYTVARKMGTEYSFRLIADFILYGAGGVMLVWFGLFQKKVDQ